MTRATFFCLAVAALSTACGSEPVALSVPAPVVDSVSVVANADNVLSAVVSAWVSFADSAAVLFRLAGAGDHADSLTAAVAVNVGRADVPVLGLLPQRQYEMRVVAYGHSRTTVGGLVNLTTGALPGDLPSYTASGDGASPGYVAMAAGMYGVVIDNTGRVVWYHRFTNGPWLNFEAQANGRYVARKVTPDPLDIEPWLEVDVLGNTKRTFGCELGLQARFHDMLMEPGGGYWMICDETRSMDLTAFGGVATAKVTGQAIQHVSASGELLFNWSPFDHFLITDVDSSQRTGANVNWTHANSLDLDGDGNILVSFRNLNEITNIDTRTGQVRWRFGGLRNQFALSGDDKLFAGQHSIRWLPSGELLLLDNVGDPLESRAERWRLEVSTRTAVMTGSHGSVPGVRTLIGGSVQSLPSSRTLVSFGTEGRVEEYDDAGVVRWRIDGAPGYVFRAQRFRSLYHPGVSYSR